MTILPLSPTLCGAALPANGALPGRGVLNRRVLGGPQPLESGPAVRIALERLWQELSFLVLHGVQKHRISQTEHHRRLRRQIS